MINSQSSKSSPLGRDAAHCLPPRTIRQYRVSNFPEGDNGWPGLSNTTPLKSQIQKEPSIKSSSTGQNKLSTPSDYRAAKVGRNGAQHLQSIQLPTFSKEFDYLPQPVGNSIDSLQEMMKDSR